MAAGSRAVAGGGGRSLESSRARLLFLAVVAAALFLGLVGTGAVPLMDPDEARFARTSVEMARSGDLVVPTFEDAPRLVKPPLLHWIQVPLFRTLGANPWTARLPSILATLASILVAGWVAARRFGPEGALWTAVVMATSPLVLAGARVGTLDALLAVHVLAIVALDIAEPGEVGPYRALAMGALAGLAFLAKGPVGIVLPVFVVLAGRTASGRSVVPAPITLVTAVAGWCALVLPWGLVFLRRLGGGSVVDILRGELLARVFDGTVHVEPPWYYAPVLMVGFVPWVAPLAAGLVRVLVRRRDPAVRTALYCGAGLIAGVLLLSLSKGKLPTYLLPLSPLVAILVTWELGQELDAPSERRIPAMLTCGLMGGFALVLMVVTAVPSYPEAARETAGIGALIWIVAGLAAFLGVVRNRPRQVYGFAAAGGFAFLLTVVLVFLPAHGTRRSAFELSETVPLLHGSRPLAVVEMNLPSLTFYLDRVPERVDADGVAARLDRGDDPLLVFDRRDLDTLPEPLRARVEIVGAAGKYVVCVPVAPPGPPAGSGLTTPIGQE